MKFSACNTHGNDHLWQIFLALPRSAFEINKWGRRNGFGIIGVDSRLKAPSPTLHVDWGFWQI